MKVFILAIVAVVCVVFVAAEEDALSKAVDKYIEKLGLEDVEDLNEDQYYDLNGQLLKEFKLIGENGKLLENGIETFSKTLPEKYFKEFPHLLEDLKKIAPQLQNATDVTDAGRIADQFVQALFETEIMDV